MRFLSILSCLTAMVVALLSLASSCDDGGGDYDAHWFDCKPVLAKLESCGAAVALDGVNETPDDVAYDSCQYAHGAMWQKMYKCYKDDEECADFIACLPDHGFLKPDDSADDDSVDDDTTGADDDSIDDAAAL